MLEELQKTRAKDTQNPPKAGQPSEGDKFRRSKIAAVEQMTGRPLIVYASACITPGKNIPSQMLMVDFSDKIGFRTVTELIDPPNLDVMIHSPGGLAEAAESLVQQLRGKYTNIRFIVPAFAKSAATMLALSGNEILMSTDAELGPIDPQFVTAHGVSPAEAIIEQFQKAQLELQKDPTKLPSWMPILAPLGPSLLVDCAHAIDLSKNLVKTWTKNYMFSGDPDAENKSDAICGYLSTHANFKSHARAIKIAELLQRGVKAIDLSTLPDLALAVDELYCCIDILLGNSPVYKLFENSKGHALIRQQQQLLVPGPTLIKKKTP